MHYFDYERVAREAGLGPDEVGRIGRVVRADYPTDDMLYELHVLRACFAIRDGRITIEEALEPEPAARNE